MQKKKILLILMSCLLVAGMSVGVTYAVLTARDSAVNELSVGVNEIEVVEDFDPPAEMNPGTEFTKTVQVHNTGDIPCYVRARIIFSDSAMENLCELRYDTEKYNPYLWEYNEHDGYYYYRELLSPAEASDPLFEKVKLDENASAADLVNFDIVVYAESRNAVNTIDEDGKEVYSSYRQAWNLESEGE